LYAAPDKLFCLLCPRLNHQWIIGYGQFTDSFTTSQKARILFDNNNYTIIVETRKLAFRAAQGNISDNNGNLLFASNGCWIKNVSFHYTPTHASWLNQVEVWVSILSRQALKNKSFTSKEQLVQP
jgi:transposase